MYITFLMYDGLLVRERASPQLEQLGRPRRRPRRRLAAYITLPLSCHYIAITLPLYCHYLAITLPLRFHYIAITLSLHCHYIAITLPLHCHYIAITLAFTLYYITLQLEHWGDHLGDSLLLLDADGSGRINLNEACTRTHDNDVAGTDLARFETKSIIPSRPDRPQRLNTSCARTRAPTPRRTRCSSAADTTYQMLRGC